MIDGNYEFVCVCCPCEEVVVDEHKVLRCRDCGMQVIAKKVKIDG